MKHIKLFENFDKDEYNSDSPSTPAEVVDAWYTKTDDTFFPEFFKTFPTKKEFEDEQFGYYDVDVDIDTPLEDIWDPETEIHMLEKTFKNFPGEDYWVDFYNDLDKSGW